MNDSLAFDGYIAITDDYRDGFMVKTMRLDGSYTSAELRALADHLEPIEKEFPPAKVEEE